MKDKCKHEWSAKEWDLKNSDYKILVKVYCIHCLKEKYLNNK